MDDVGPSFERIQLTQRNVEAFNDGNAEKEIYIRKSHGTEKQMNESIRSGEDSEIPKYSPVKRSDPNKKYIPTQMFVNGEGTIEGKRTTNET